MLMFNVVYQIIVKLIAILERQADKREAKATKAHFANLDRYEAMLVNADAIAEAAHGLRVSSQQEIEKHLEDVAKARDFADKLKGLV